MIQMTDELYQRWRRGHDMVAKLDKLFVVGCAKSGTTWVMKLLNGHPGIVIRGEGGFTYQLVPLLSQAFRVFNEHQRRQDPITHLRDVDLLLTARAVIDGQLARYVDESGRDPLSLRVVGDKTPQHTISLGVLAQLYPEAKFIHIIRDPRDVTTSAWFHFGKNDKRSFEEYVRYFITQVWPVNVGGARQAAPSFGSRYCEVRYEDLHGHEPEHTKAFLEFLGVDASEAPVRACLEAGDFRRLSGGRERGEKDNDKFFRSGTIGDWRNHLPLDLVESCCGEIAPLMSECGYDPSGAAVSA